MENKSHQFDKVIFEDSEILILGSFPSVVSLQENFYYMNKNNRFYKVLSNLYKEDFYTVDVKQKINLLKKHHIALYDVILNCDIHGSSDVSIRKVIPTNIQELVDKYPIKKIFLNGKKAYDLFIKYNEDLKKMATYLPSTSSANASYSLEKLIEEWKVILL